MPSAPTQPLRAVGIGRAPDNDRLLLLYLNRPISDDEMRVIHDALGDLAGIVDAQRRYAERTAGDAPRLN